MPQCSEHRNEDTGLERNLKLWASILSEHFLGLRRQTQFLSRFSEVASCGKEPKFYPSIWLKNLKFYLNMSWGILVYFLSGVLFKPNYWVLLHSLKTLKTRPIGQPPRSARLGTVSKFKFHRISVSVVQIQVRAQPNYLSTFQLWFSTRYSHFSNKLFAFGIH